MFEKESYVSTGPRQVQQRFDWQEIKNAKPDIGDEVPKMNMSSQTSVRNGETTLNHCGSTDWEAIEAREGRWTTDIKLWRSRRGIYI